MMRKKPITSRPIGVGIRMRRVAKGGEVVIDAPAPPPRPPVEVTLKNLDAILITADWFLYEEPVEIGNILQLFARVVEPVDSGMIGWSVCYPFQFPETGLPRNAIIYYGGNDNNRPEQFWVNLYAVNQQFGSRAVKIELYARWFGDKGDGLVDISACGERNGSLGTTSTSVIYSNGGIILGTAAARVIVETEGGACEIEPELVATVEYDGDSLTLTPA